MEVSAGSPLSRISEIKDETRRSSFRPSAAAVVRRRAAAAAAAAVRRSRRHRRSEQLQPVEILYNRKQKGTSPPHFCPLNPASPSLSPALPPLAFVLVSINTPNPHQHPHLLPPDLPLVVPLHCHPFCPLFSFPLSHLSWSSCLGTAYLLPAVLSCSTGTINLCNIMRVAHTGSFLMVIGTKGKERNVSFFPKRYNF